MSLRAGVRLENVLYRPNIWSVGALWYQRDHFSSTVLITWNLYYFSLTWLPTTQVNLNMDLLSPWENAFSSVGVSQVQSLALFSSPHIVPLSNVIYAQSFSHWYNDSYIYVPKLFRSARLLQPFQCPEPLKFSIFETNFKTMIFASLLYPSYWHYQPSLT